MGVEQVARAQINDSRLVIYGLTDSGSTEAVVYNTEWGATEPSITTEPLEPLGIGPIVPAAEVDFGAGYEKARAAMSTCNQEIAYKLGISHQTVKNHMTAILQKLDVEDRTQAAIYAVKHGWVRLQENDGKPDIK